MTRRQFRTMTRAIHLIAAAVAAFVVYAPAVVSADTARTVLAFVVIPLLSLSGLVVWQQARLRRLFKGSSAGTRTTAGAGRVG